MHKYAGSSNVKVKINERLKLDRYLKFTLSQKMRLHDFSLTNQDHASASNDVHREPLISSLIL